MKRAICPHCEYIIDRCLCSTLRPINNKTQLIILQHPSETRHALNTTRLMKKSFSNMEIFIGENFSEHQELNTLIDNHHESICLIFPLEEKILLPKSSSSIFTHIILLDGTWKKARKIYLSSINLHQLKTFSLASEKISQYKIRASGFPQSLSTLEAAICALGSIEADLVTESLENSFAKMIDFQIDKMGEETFQKNYKSKLIE